MREYTCSLTMRQHVDETDNGMFSFSSLLRSNNDDNNNAFDQTVTPPPSAPLVFGICCIHTMVRYQSLQQRGVMALFLFWVENRLESGRIFVTKCGQCHRLECKNACTPFLPVPVLALDPPAEIYIHSFIHTFQINVVSNRARYLITSK